MPTLTHNLALVCYDDSTPSNNPLMRFIDWRKSVQGVCVQNPLNHQYYIQPNSSESIFSGTRNLTLDGTTQLSLVLNSRTPNLYRLKWSSGTLPGFRTTRTITVLNTTLTFTVNNNSTVTVQSTETNAFNNVQIGDTIFFPTAYTGDQSLASTINPLNGGGWVILTKTNSSLTLTRFAGQSFSGINQTVLITNADWVKIYSSEGVQEEDTLEISAGFSPITRKSFTIKNVTDTWVEFLSNEPLPLENNVIIGTTGIVFYTASKRFLRVEVDQEALLSINDGSSIRVVPRIFSDKDGVGWFELWGSCWSLSITNLSKSNKMRVTIISAE